MSESVIPIIEHDAWTLILAARRLTAMSDADLATVRADLAEAVKLLNRRLANDGQKVT